MRELSLFAFKCTVLGQICLKTHFELWVAQIEIWISPRDLFIMTLFQFACGCRGEKPQVLRAALLLQATRPRLLRMHKEAINYIFQFDSLCTKHLRPNVNWAHFSAAQFSPKPRTIHFPRFLCLLHAGMQVFRVYLHNSTTSTVTLLFSHLSLSKDPSLFPHFLVQF